MSRKTQRIYISRKEDCCGCSACVVVCPTECISFITDKEGFWYPDIDDDKCINCGKCVRVCPILNERVVRVPLRTVAAINNESEIRERSSSGGLFYPIAEQVIDHGGVVFGAKFNKVWDVVHDFTETKEGLIDFMGSKYVQSSMGKSYKEAKNFLSIGKEVLFSGTPCHIAGLKNYLGKEYDNLTTVDFVCHGVPSPKVWSEYLKSIVDNEKITSINFRSKSEGWKLFGLEIKQGTMPIIHENLKDNLYLSGFLRDIYLRPSCYECAFKSFKSGSDITLADYWGVQFIHPEIDDDKGTSLCFINTHQGQKLVSGANVFTLESSYYKALKYNPSIERSVKRPEKARSGFFAAYEKDPKQLNKSIIKYSKEAKKLSLAGYMRYVINRALAKLRS